MSYSLNLILAFSHAELGLLGSLALLILIINFYLKFSKMLKLNHGILGCAYILLDSSSCRFGL